MVEKLELILGFDIANYSKIKSILKNTYIHKDISVSCFKYYPVYPIYNRKSITSLKNILVTRYPKLSKNVVIHVRGEGLGFIVDKALRNSDYNKNILVDVRGASIEEIKSYRDLGIFKRYGKLSIKKEALRNLKNIQYISVVSQNLKKYLESKWSSDNNISVIHSLSGEHFQFNIEKRQSIRQILGINNDDILFIFCSGGTGKWQNNELIIKAVTKLGYKILNLSPVKVSNKNVINKFVKYSEVPNYLSAADIAIIWRNEGVVNKVASPVKFSEYICNGLPVISNRSVKMIYDVITKYKCGKIVANIESITKELVNELLAMNRVSISSVGQEIFGIQSIASKYKEVYLKILNKNR